MFPKNQAVFVTAAATPVDSAGDLLEESFRKHLRHQLDHGIDGLLVCGSMGQMVCLKHATYLQSVRAAVAETAAQAQIMVGVGDNSIERTLERIDALRGLNIDAVAATTPYYFVSSQKDLLYYFTRLAETSPFPLYLYDLPQVTKVKIELETMLRLSEHPNIHGAKCSHDPAFVRMLFDATANRDFQVISAHYDLIDMFLAHGIGLQLDGFFCLIPEWLEQIKAAYRKRDFPRITEVQMRMTALRNAFLAVGVFPALTEAMNLLGFPGRFHPSHMAPLDDAAKAEVKRLMADYGLLSSTAYTASPKRPDEFRVAGKKRIGPGRPDH